jgi:hypothetical protein
LSGARFLNKGRLVFLDQKAVLICVADGENALQTVQVEGELILNLNLVIGLLEETLVELRVLLHERHAVLGVARDRL